MNTAHPLPSPCSRQGARRVARGGGSVAGAVRAAQGRRPHPPLAVCVRRAAAGVPVSLGTGGGVGVGNVDCQRSLEMRWSGRWGQRRGEQRTRPTAAECCWRLSLLLPCVLQLLRRQDGRCDGGELAARRHAARPLHCGGDFAERCCHALRPPPGTIGAGRLSQLLTFWGAAGCGIRG